MLLKLKTDLKYFMLSLLTLLLVGILLSIFMLFLKGNMQLFILMLVGTLIAILAHSVLNLFYFIPESLLKYKYILPGMIGCVSVLLFFKSSFYDLFFQEIISVSNLFLGIFWTNRTNKIIE